MRIAVSGMLLAGITLSAMGAEVRPPAAPLITHDPYMSCWSMNDRLYDDWPKHWTGRVHAMCGLIRVDGAPMRFMGAAAAESNAVVQRSLVVGATQTGYAFACGTVDLTVTFTSPLLPDDLDVFSRPASYITFSAKSNDGKPHAVQIYFDASAEWCVNEPQQAVTWARVPVQGLDVMRIGTVDQKTLERKGDNVRIDWGHLMIAVSKEQPATAVIGAADNLRSAFNANQSLPSKDDEDMPRAAEDRWPVLAVSFDLGQVTDQSVQRRLTMAYDDVYSIEYMQKPLRAWWRRNADMTPERMLELAEAEYAPLMERCAAFDQQLMTDATSIGGGRYAHLCALAYRQAMAGNKLAAGPGGQPFLFPKECFSNGCIGTVDIIYPQAPVFLYYNTVLARATLTPVMEYAASPRWKFAFAPHDLGTYPQANGQVYGGGEKTEENQMQVEESGNLLILVAAIAKLEGSPEYAQKYWPLLTRWAEYLKQKGLDPENQLCTDDFTGHLAHNVNLSAKAIAGLGSYALLCEMAGKTAEAATYRALSKEFAAKWVPMADDGDHFRLAFDKPGTWSQKYNLVWDRLLGLNLFPKEVTQKEIAYYKKMQNVFGLPLDNRNKYTKTDWLVWTATLADSQEDFLALFTPVFSWMNQTPSRVPLTDWYDTETGKMAGFQARPVIGGVFIKLLTAKLPGNL